MPTIILLDVSLSMSKPINEDNTTSSTPNKLVDILTSKSLQNFFKTFQESNRCEYMSLIVFSSFYQVLATFTKDFLQLQKVTSSAANTYDKANYLNALQFVENYVIEEWGYCVPINLVVITDGICGIGEGSLKDTLKTIAARKGSEHRFPIPYSFPCHFSVLLINSEENLKTNRQYFEQLIKINHGKGEILTPSSLTQSGIDNIFQQLLLLHYKKQETQLSCGHFSSAVTLSPAVNLSNSLLSITSLNNETIDPSKYKLSSTFFVLGFIDLQDLANPSYLSRHIVFPVTPEEKKDKDNIGFQPSFCVLLHGALKMEKMGAIVELSDNWYGMLYSWADSKKKSTLMLSVFEPGSPIPWLGELTDLGPAFELPVNPYQYDSKENAEDTPFPISQSTRRSYHTQSNAVFIKSSGLQSDVQKLLRYARKLPDKQSAFFKEVNKLRRAGVMYCFHELLNELATALENEGSKTSPEVSVQLRHVAEGLRNAPYRDASKNIVAINMFRKKSSD